MMTFDRSKNEKSIYSSCVITMVGPKAEVRECASLLRRKTADMEININKKLMDTLNLLVATYDLYVDKFPNSADILKYAMDVAHTGMLRNCPHLVRIDKNLEGVEVVLNFINNIMIENKGAVKWGDTYFSYYHAPRSEEFLKNYPYKFKETYKLFADTVYPDTVMSYMYRLEQKSIEELFDNGEVNSDKIDYMASEYYNGDYEVCGVLKQIADTKYKNGKVTYDDRRQYRHYEEKRQLIDYLYSHLEGYDNKSIRVMTATYANLRSIPLDMVLALSFKYDNSYFSIQYIGENEVIKTYIFNNGNIVANDVNNKIKKEFLVKEIADLLSEKYFLSTKALNKYIKEFKYVMANNFNEPITFEEFVKIYYGENTEFEPLGGYRKDLEKCFVDKNKSRKLFFGKGKKTDKPKKLYKKTYSEKSEEIYEKKKNKNTPVVIEHQLDKYKPFPNKISIEDYEILKYRDEKLKDFK